MPPEINFMLARGGPWHERHAREWLADMKSAGADSVCAAFLEDTYSLTGLRWIAELAHDEGLRLYAMPGRIGLLFSAGPRLGSPFTFRTPQARMVGEAGGPVGGFGYAACVNASAFKEWFYLLVTEAVRDSGADGILFDEPKSASVPCFCPVCREIAGSSRREDLAALRERSMAEMMGKTSSAVKGIAPSNSTIAMLGSKNSDRFLDALTEQPDLDAVGFDAPPCARAGSVGNPAKPLVFDSASRLIPRIRRRGKKTFVLVETFYIPASSHSEFTANMERLSEIEADIFSFNYYGQEVEEPDVVMDITRQAIARLRNPKNHVGGSSHGDG